MADVTRLWAADQQRQTGVEMLRNKGLICRDHFLNGSCPLASSCSYMHIRKGETRRVPLTVCHFYTKRACLRDGCMFFHGTQEELDQLRASGATTYRPQDYMALAAPPPACLHPEGNMPPQILHMPPVASHVDASVDGNKLGKKYQTYAPVLLLPTPTAALTQYGAFVLPLSYGYGTPVGPLTFGVQRVPELPAYAPGAVPGFH
ncbi:hypothetical protein DQ04_00251140 [Trypanosoma grayi]|uniref:hypothetical protein n=1 Tax=Trypanosoma grayi TaxID=71804 RepID=UPI0004F4973B|nr:hypothetical protein DQ04_00251140 [Trypanosoma grayi]KEG14938.1 hypothetical protein DQ04_00251140 [Trypanosoma grayi]